MSYNELPTYQGYTNYPTWVVELWLDNDQSSYNEIMQMARCTDSAYELASELKDMHEDANPLDIACGAYSDLMGWVLGQVNWLEIAENYLEAVREEDDYEGDD